MIAFRDPACTPEDPEHTMNTFPKDNPEAQSLGATLRAEVALPCWSRIAEDRPTMENVEVILRNRFGPF